MSRLFAPDQEVNPYTLLGYEAGEAHAQMTDEQLRDLYRVAAWITHPDRTQRDTTAEFVAVIAAYRSVRNAQARARTRQDMVLHGWETCVPCSGSGAVPDRRMLVTCMRCAGCGLVPPGAPTAPRRIRKIRRDR